MAPIGLHLLGLPEGGRDPAAPLLAQVPASEGVAAEPADGGGAGEPGRRRTAGGGRREGTRWLKMGSGSAEDGGEQLAGVCAPWVCERWGGAGMD